MTRAPCMLIAWPSSPPTHRSSRTSTRAGPRRTPSQSAGVRRGRFEIRELNEPRPIRSDPPTPGGGRQGPGHQLLTTTHGDLDCLGAIDDGRVYDDLLAQAAELRLASGLTIRVLGLAAAQGSRGVAGPESDARRGGAPLLEAASSPLGAVRVASKPSQRSSSTWTWTCTCALTKSATLGPQRDRGRRRADLARAGFFFPRPMGNSPSSSGTAVASMPSQPSGVSSPRAS